MKFISTQSLKENILEALQQCRQKTLNLFKGIDCNTFCQQAHPDFSPVGWHLGHIAFTEAYWILEYCGNFSPVFPKYHQLFAADGLIKEERQNLPSLEIIQDYLDTVRSKVLDYLATAPIEKEERLWRWLIQHESQHSETITFVLQIHHWQNNITPNPQRCAFPCGGNLRGVAPQSPIPIYPEQNRQMVLKSVEGLILVSLNLLVTDSKLGLFQDR